MNQIELSNYVLKYSCFRYVFDILNMLQGVYLFVIFVLKHSVLFEIRKKYSGQGDNIDMLSLSDGKETLYTKLTYR